MRLSNHGRAKSRRKLHGLALAVLLVTLCYGSASAVCKDGAVPDYNDVDAVLFSRHGCIGWYAHGSFDAELRCSAYWLFASTLDGTATYSQYTLKGERGTYRLSLSLADIRQLLRKNDFFGLTGEPARLGTFMGDVREAVVTVRRCAVVTKLFMIPIPNTLGFDDKINALFIGFDGLVKRSKKSKMSKNPSPFLSAAFGDE